MHTKPVDKILLFLVLAMVSFGFLIFSSASLGLLSRNGANFSSVAFNQFLFGIVGGSLAMFIASNIHYRYLRRFAFYIFVFSIILTSLVFIGDIGDTHGGATRWIRIGNFSFQPAEILKLGFIIYLATWLSGIKNKINKFKSSTLPFFGLISLVGIIMLKQPDTDSFLIMAIAGTAMFITAGGRWRDVLIMGILGTLLILAIALLRPYIMERMTTFLHPEQDPQGSGYQIQQSLIAVGSGGISGRGFGQSIQKFEYLPEPIGDPIFAVYAEEFGFLGGVFLILLFLALTFRGYKIALRANDLFGTLLVVGFMTLIICQAFLNIGAMVGVAPLSGLPLPFISHGGTTLLVTLTMIGIVLNVSKYPQKKYRA